MNADPSADTVRTKIRTRRGKILGWHWSFFYWDGMYRVHWWRQSDGVALENPGDFEAPGRGRKVSGSAPGTPVKRASETTASDHSDGDGRAS